MAEDIQTTVQFQADISDFKGAMQEANRSIKLANSEFKAASSGMDDWSDSTDGLTAKLKQLSSLHDAQRRKLDVLKWEWMEENSFFDYFTVEKLFAFLVKIQIIERWITLDAEAGGEMLRGMIRQLKEEVKVPQEFTINNKK